ncbi:transketolase [Candidatus Peregrinibacteria bacterium]|jgi:transketolase|nr:transketolase [Candidatus Peregrinibacteria bacterium]MBT7703102.1 transketolase [Candidatus Peregrinibacteria bacterium]
MTYPKNLTPKERLRKAIQMRRDIVEMVNAAGSGHPGGSLSSVELLVTLYNEYIKHDPSNPKWKDRDYMIFCKCHITPAIYSILARVGYFDPKTLLTFRKLGSDLQGHPSRFHPLGLEMSGGSLGQNLSIATGVALGLKTQNKPNRVWALSSEGDLQEGQSWEAIMSAAHFRLDNLTLLVDYNKLQIDGHCEDVMGVHPLDEKFKSFNWHTLVIEDGHDFDQVREALDKAATLEGRPKVIIAHTIKGKGISYMENVAGWHGKAPDREHLGLALDELKKREDSLTPAQ